VRFPREHWPKVRFTNPLEHVNLGARKRNTKRAGRPREGHHASGLGVRL
jgi:hypothetical protein